VDVSNGGVLVETTSKLPLGSTIDLRIIGPETNLSVLARIARTEVARRGQPGGRGPGVRSAAERAPVLHRRAMREMRRTTRI
jgi:PilZ domain